MHLVILEPFEAGHRPSYVRWIATAMLEAGMKALTEPSRLPERTRQQ